MCSLYLIIHLYLMKPLWVLENSLKLKNYGEKYQRLFSILNQINNMDYIKVYQYLLERKNANNGPFMYSVVDVEGNATKLISYRWCFKWNIIWNEIISKLPSYSIILILKSLTFRLF